MLLEKSTAQFKAALSSNACNTSLQYLIYSDTEESRLRGERGRALSPTPIKI